MWVLVDARTNRVITQKQHPQLALVQPFVDLDRQTMTLCAPQCSDVLVISLHDGSVSIGRSTRCIATIVQLKQSSILQQMMALSTDHPSLRLTGEHAMRRT